MSPAHVLVPMEADSRSAERTARVPRRYRLLVSRTSSAFIFASVGLLLLALSHDVRAAEGGVGAYAPGSFASSMDALPTKPGFALFNYFTFYNGKAGASRTLPIAGQVSANVEATIYVDTLGGFWITPHVPRRALCRRRRPSPHVEHGQRGRDVARRWDHQPERLRERDR